MTCFYKEIYEYIYSNRRISYSIQVQRLSVCFKITFKMFVGNKWVDKVINFLIQLNSLFIGSLEQKIYVDSEGGCDEKSTVIHEGVGGLKKLLKTGYVVYGRSLIYVVTHD